MLNFDSKLARLIAYAMGVMDKHNPEAPWYGAWGFALTRIIDSGEHLVLFPQPRYRADATSTFRVPDFDVAEIVLNEATHEVSRRPLLIVELKAPIAPHNIGENPQDDPNFDLLESTYQQAELQVAHVFASLPPPHHVIGVVGVGRLWNWTLFERTPSTPTRNPRESSKNFIQRFLDVGSLGTTLSSCFHLGTAESDHELDTLGMSLVDSQQMV